VLSFFFSLARALSSLPPSLPPSPPYLAPYLSSRPHASLLPLSPSLPPSLSLSLSPHTLFLWTGTYENVYFIKKKYISYVPVHRKKRKNIFHMFLSIEKIYFFL
jgi:hypothetical protein